MCGVLDTTVATGPSIYRIKLEKMPQKLTFDSCGVAIYTERKRPKARVDC